MLMSDDRHFPAWIGVPPGLSGVWPSLTGEGRNFPSFHAWKPEITQPPRGFKQGFDFTGQCRPWTWHIFFSKSDSLTVVTCEGHLRWGFKWRGIYGAIFFSIWAVNLTFGISFFWTRKDEVEDHWNHLLYTMQSWWSEKMTLIWTCHDIMCVYMQIVIDNYWYEYYMYICI